MIQHRTQFAFKGKREHIAKVNMPNIAYPNQHIDIEILHGSRDHVIIPDTVKITFNLDITSTYKGLSVVNNIGRAVVKKNANAWFERFMTHYNTFMTLCTFMTHTRIFT